ncbi:hypothetical protein SLS56_007422 [Neofusicoccum ribis]|uniref:cutinase n=1 Tax=Neofusicoccum ribis TaxID=45134 RepID=A0ABR3SNM1_9PEZI
MKGLLRMLILAAGLAAASPLPGRLDVSADSQSPGLVARAFSSSTQNDLASGSPCKKVALIFARGTSETGNMGSVVGPPLATNLASSVGSDSLAVQGVEYAASASGAASGGDTAGAQKMAQLATDVVKKCPDTQVVLAGYSQGAQLVHKAGAQLDSTTAAKVKAVTVFGDPMKGQAIKNIDASKVKTFCNDVSWTESCGEIDINADDFQQQGDQVCNGMFVITQAHLQYGSDTPAAASFIKGKVSV